MIFYREDNLNNREKEILKAVIHSYLLSAEAVSSKFLVDNFRLNVSSATVRNIMAELERKGFIKQPHTSAGRVPTDDGYRFYVNKLMELRALTKLEEERITKEYFSKKRELDFIMHQTSRALSSLTNYTGLVSLPAVKREQLNEIKLVQLDTFRIMVIAVFSTGVIKNKIVTLNVNLSLEELKILTISLNMFFKDSEISFLEKSLNKKIYSLLIQLSELDIFAISGENVRDIYMEGKSNFASYPEFKNYEKLSKFLRLLDEKGEINKIIESSLSDQGVSIYIGKEDSGIEDCSIVTAPYQIAGENAGVLGVIGPKRMMYSKVVSAVDYLAKSVSRLLLRR